MQPLSLVRLILIFSALGSVAACSAYLEPSEYRALVESDVVSIDKTRNTMLFQPVTTDKVHKLELGGSLRVYDFGSGLTLYEGFEIPEARPITVRVDSMFSGYMQADEHITIPTLLFLDESHNEILSVVSDMRQGAAANAATLFTHEMEVPAQSRFLVIFVDPTNAPSTFSWHYAGVSVGSGLDGAGRGNKTADVGIGGPIWIRFEAVEEAR